MTPAQEQEKAERAAQEAKLAQEQWVDDLKFVMGDRRGRRFVWRLLVEAGVYQTVFNESHAISSLLEGKRQIGLFLVDETNAECPQEYDRMKAEQRKNVRTEHSDG